MNTLHDFLIHWNVNSDSNLYRDVIALEVICIYLVKYVEAFWKYRDQKC